MLPPDPYSQAHLFVAAIRVYEHLHRRPPSIKGLAEMLELSEEEISLVSRRLEEKGIIGVVVSGGRQRFVVGEYAGIEDLPRSAQAPGLEDEISRFRARQETRLKDIEASLSRSGEKSGVFS